MATGRQYSATVGVSESSETIAWKVTGKPETNEYPWSAPHNILDAPNRKFDPPKNWRVNFMPVMPKGE